ncbi:type II toxin-antitoxin system VapC family toxin [Prosthecobacter sp. SYSU 5D2]|uniref:type II toxin-antitoxin system VapC family toxin n=1 Tax=Prosthecobacter sp. SYSU 5D2 TaxID=3134134 RepID=UPI0031FE9629
MVLVDTNILIDIATKDLQWYAWSSAQLASLVSQGKAAINPIIYAELAPAFANETELDSKLLPPDLIIRLPLPYSAAFSAARAFMSYRKSGGIKTSPLPDFYIGAHAEAESLTLLTRDPVRYRTYFPQVQLITP